MLRHPLAAFLFLSTLAACASTTSDLRVVRPASAEENAALFARVAALEGRWRSTTPEQGASDAIASEFRVSSNGSIVREIMFPGTEHEMTNVYHMDGGALVLTHYCAMGNQPHMRAQLTTSNVIDFRLDNVTNLRAPEESYMGALRLELVGPDHVRQHWTNFRRGAVDHSATFELRRVK